MLTTKAFFAVTLICVFASITSSAGVPASQQSSTDELPTCEEQLSKYRRFILQAIISFEDVCDAYNIHDLNPNDGAFRTQDPERQFFRQNFQPIEQRTEIWAFFKLLMAQFNDIEFLNVIRDAVIERCHIKSQLQKDEKRNSVVLGKKQRFHSWGGKRAPTLAAGQSYLEERNGEKSYFL